ncbi:MAG: ABC transporter permease [Lachnospiraceae bacterium]|nr:ABC transporter permease [Lachnospiraceae bacterium]
MKRQLQQFYKYRFLLNELVKKGIRLKYRRSYLGIMWSLLEPLLEMVVLSIVFGTLFGNNDKTFPVYILSARLLYSLFSTATKGALRSVRSNASMIKKVYVPKYLYPMSSVLFNFVIFLISLIDLVGVMFVLGVYPTKYLLLSFIPLGILLMLTYGAGMILATMGVFFRDMEYLWNVALMLIMYTCAIFYKPERLLDSGFWWILKFNPLYGVISQFRNCVYGQPLDMWTICYSAIFSAVALLVGLYVFKKKQDEFILHI